MRTVQRRTLAVFGSVAALALVLSGCGTPDPGTGDGGGGEAGGSLTVVKAIESNSLDAALLGNGTISGGAAGNAIYDQLLYIDPETTEIQYQLATDFSSEDGVTWNLELRPDVTFSDGTPFNADAVKFSWERVQNPELASPARGVAARIVDITVVDDLNLTLTLDSANFKFPAVIDFFGPLNWIVSPTAVEAAGAEFGLAPVGAGPFTVEEWGAGDELHLVKNPDYWQDGLPLLDELTVLTNNDSNAAIDMVVTNAAQARLGSTRTGSDAVTDAGGVIDTLEQQGGMTLAFNTTRPPFDDIRAREAIANAIDPEFFNESTFSGSEELAQTLVTESSPYYDADLVQKHDSDKAQELFDELAADGKPLSFTFLGNPTTASVGMGQVLTAILGQYENVTVTVESADLVAYSGRMTQHDFDAALGGAAGSDPDLAFYEYFRTGGATNVMGWEDAEATEALEAARATDDPEKQAAAYQTLQERVLEEVPVMFLVRLGGVIMHNPDMKGLKLYGNGSPIFTNVTYSG